MKLKIITFLLLSLPVFTMGQTPNVQKLINGKPCDSCFVKSDLSFSNILPHAFIGTYTNPARLSSELTKFKESISQEKNESSCYLITDSILNLVFLTESDADYQWPIQSARTKNYDYKKVEILIEKNKKQLVHWQILDNLPPVDRYRINRITYDEKNQKDRVGSWSSTHQTGEIHFDYNDLVTITLRETESKEIIRKLFIKRILDKPHHFIYYQASMNTSQFKESLQSFLNDPLSSEKVSQGDTTTSVSLQRNNIGVLLFNGLENGEEIEYTFDKEHTWKTIRKGLQSVFPSKFIILDNEDIPPGTTKSLYMRYKDQPQTEIVISIRGIEDFTQTSLFKIIAGFMLASLVFGSWYYFKHRRTQRKLAQLDQKNNDIETQLSLLSGQLNPHFLFNSLHAIQGSIINNDIETANAYISSVATFMRRVMDDGKKEFISLQEEINLEIDYLKLEQKRKEFSYKITICPAIDTSKIDFPPLLLQPVLENSIRHGLTQTIDNPNIEIVIEKERENLVIKIIDNGLYWDVSKLIEGQGLSLTQKRMTVYNQKLDTMKISWHTVYSKGTITTFTFKNWLT